MTIATRTAWLLERGAPIAAACAAACASLPGLRFPFLSDDWHLIESVRNPMSSAAAYGYFRPIYVATFWFDWNLWGLSPSLFHLTNLLLIAASAALVVVLARRYTGDARTAALAGLLFAVHPYHVENAAWVAVRGDPLYSVFLLLAAWSYDRWRAGRAGAAGTDAGADEARGWPVTALLLFECALLAKESAVVLPALLVAIGLVDRSRRPGRREWLSGLAPLALLALVHFLLIRPLTLGGAARTLAPGTVIGWLRHAIGFVVGAMVPVDAEILAFHPAPWTALAAASLLALLAPALMRRPRSVGPALASAAAFGVLLLPSIVGFQERYLFLPIAAFALGLACLIRALPRRTLIAASAIVVTGWTFCWYAQWKSWQEAALASRELVAGLVEASQESGTREIVVANMPFRVRGGSVAGDFQAALRLSGGRPLPVRAAAYVSYPMADEDLLDGPLASAIRSLPDRAEVRMRIIRAPFTRLVSPGPVGTVTDDGDGRVRVEVPAAPGRAVYVWIGGQLERLM